MVDLGNYRPWADRGWSYLASRNSTDQRSPLCYLQHGNYATRRTTCIMVLVWGWLVVHRFFFVISYYIQYVNNFFFMHIIGMDLWYNFTNVIGYVIKKVTMKSKQEWPKNMSTLKYSIPRGCGFVYMRFDMTWTVPFPWIWLFDWLHGLNNDRTYMHGQYIPWYMV